VLSDTLDDGLRSYAIGEKVRALRLRKKLGLVELARHTGLSPSMLSKLERGRTYPTLATLLRIALVFGVGLDHFFAPAAPARKVGVVRRGERRRFPERPGRGAAAWTFECLDFTATERRMNAYWAEFQVTANTRPHEHAGEEFLYVLRGRLVVAFDDEEHTLDAGDAIYFDATQPHAYRRVGTSPCQALVVTA
jgi:transcriptional regulator with XRE-family HTH domain